MAQLDVGAAARAVAQLLDVLRNLLGAPLEAGAGRSSGRRARARRILEAARVGALLLAVVGAGCFRTKGMVARDYAARWKPAALEAGSVPSARTTPLRVRVRVAPGRRILPGWKDDFELALEDANAVLAGHGLHLRVVEYAGWEGDLGPDLSAEALLARLAASDLAHDVDLVIGLASPLGLYTDAMDAIGYAYVPGRHVVLRSFTSVAEREGFRQAFDGLSEAEHDRFLRRWKRHRDAVVLLHEVGHAAGVGHVEESGEIMAADYDHRAARFGGAAQRGLEAYVERLVSEASREGVAEGAIGAPEGAVHEHRNASFASTTALTAEARVTAARAAIRAFDLEGAERILEGEEHAAACELRVEAERLRHRLPAEDLPEARRAEVRQRLAALLAPDAHRQRGSDLAALIRDFPDSDAERIGRCFVAVERRRPARALCAEAVTQNPDAALAQLLWGVTLERESASRSIEAWMRAVLLDPGLKLGWRKLEAHLRGAAGRRMLAELEARTASPCGPSE